MNRPPDGRQQHGCSWPFQMLSIELRSIRTSGRSPARIRDRRRSARITADIIGAGGDLSTAAATVRQVVAALPRPAGIGATLTVPAGSGLMAAMAARTVYR